MRSELESALAHHRETQPDGHLVWPAPPGDDGRVASFWWKVQRADGSFQDMNLRNVTEFYQSMMRENLEIYDRVGGGDGFASGLAYGFLEGKGPQAAVEYGAAHGALAMTTPGDTSMVNAKEVEAVMKGKGARVIR